MFVGEQPGDMEDRTGHPFVGPAGKLFDKALERAGIEREDVYITNAVKHFKWVQTPGGKKRKHKKPDLAEVMACKPWLEAELQHVQPQALVCLGATAARSLLGPTRVTQQRGAFVDSPLAPFVTATIHPSAVLRARDDESRSQEMDMLVSDLEMVAEAVRSTARAG
jgi:uracil-DNA glycosylase